MHAAPARAERVAVVVRPAFAPADFAGVGAVGEFVPGAGPKVSRASALAALETGTVRSSLLGGKPKGKRLIRVATRPGPITIYVALPPPEANDNDHRYPIAIVGAGYRGILTSSSTRIRGLVSIADIAPTALALEQGAGPKIRSSPDADAPGTLAALEQKLERVRDTRWPAELLMFWLSAAWGLVAIFARSPLAGRAAFLCAPTAVVVSLLLTAADLTQPWVVSLAIALALAVAVPGLAHALRRPVALAAALAGVLVLYLVVLSAWPEVNPLSAFGPHPDSGGRFYGVSNRGETLLLLPALLAAGLLGAWSVIPLAALALATVGLSVTGADGGGLVVFAAGFLVLLPRLRGRAVDARTVVFAAGGGLALALVLVGIDAALGGSSHVTAAVGGGPSELWHDFVRRLHLSWAGATNPWYQGVFVLIGLAVIALFPVRKPRSAVRDSLFVALAVSLLVNDAALDTLCYGALVTGPLWTWERLRPAEARYLD